MEVRVVTARTRGQLLDAGAVRKQSVEGRGQCLRGPIWNAHGGLTIPKPFVGPAAAKPDEGAAVGHRLGADEAKGFQAEDRKEDELAAVVPGRDVVRGNLPDELDSVLDAQGSGQVFEGTTVPSVSGDHQAPVVVAEPGDGLEGDLDALGWHEARWEEEKPRFLGDPGWFWNGSVKRYLIDPAGVVVVLEETVAHETRRDLKAHPGMAAYLLKVLGATPEEDVSDGGLPAAPLGVVPEEARDPVRTMAGAEVSLHPVPGGAEPGLVVQEHRCRNRGCFVQQGLAPGSVELDDVGFPLLKQRPEFSRTPIARKRPDRALDCHRPLVEVGQQDFVTGRFEEMAGLDHDPVGSPVERAGRVVDEEDAHWGARMGGRAGGRKLF